jgi:hypothetical protein
MTSASFDEYSCIALQASCHPGLAQQVLLLLVLLLLAVLLLMKTHHLMTPLLTKVSKCLTACAPLPVDVAACKACSQLLVTYRGQGSCLCIASIVMRLDHVLHGSVRHYCIMMLQLALLCCDSVGMLSCTC